MKKILSRLLPGDVITKQANKRVIMNFAESVGMVYFGHVDHREEEHKLIRGLTLSNKHRDNHYSIGSTSGYDLTLVERTDTIHVPGKPAKRHQWLIFGIDLHASVDLPHIFLGHDHHSVQFYELLFTKFSRMQKIAIGTFGTYSPSFTEHYSIFTEPAESLSAERLFSHETTRLIAAHFGPLSIEVVDNCLYLYSEKSLINRELLETMLKNGLWLADSLDKNAQHL